jgi:transcriptional regulator with XRE-family HTH domain
MTVNKNRSRVSRRDATYSDREWGEADGKRLQQLRLSLHLNQKEFAKKLGVAQSLVSAWERGKRRGRRPSSGLLLKFAAFPTLDHDEVDWLIAKAGMDPETITFAAERHLNESSPPPKPGEVTSIKPLRKLESGLPDFLKKEQPDAEIESGGPDLPFWKKAVPNSATTKYITVRDHFMRPIYKPGDILLIDQSQRDPWKLDEGACVAVYLSAEYAAQQHWPEHREKIEQENPEEELERRRSMMNFPYERVGLTVGWLRKQIESDYGWFFLEAPWLPVHKPLPARQAHHGDAVLIADLQILGRVVAWIAGPELTKRDGKK